jgi:hypothetical protein
MFGNCLVLAPTLGYIVGAPEANLASTQSGAVFIYPKTSSTSTSTNTYTLSIDGSDDLADSYSYFGTSVSALNRGNFILVSYF